MKEWESNYASLPKAFTASTMTMMDVLCRFVYGIDLRCRVIVEMGTLKERQDEKETTPHPRLSLPGSSTLQLIESVLC